MALYTDKASHFRRTCHGGLRNSVSLEHEDTKIKRALAELGIELINADSLKVGLRDSLDSFRTGIRDYKEVNRFLKEEFLSWYLEICTICEECLEGLSRGL